MPELAGAVADGFEARIMGSAAATNYVPIDGIEGATYLPGAVCLDPARTLARGWSITRDAQGRVVRSASAVGPGDRLVTTVADGEVRSTVDASVEEGVDEGEEA